MSGPASSFLRALHIGRYFNLVSVASSSILVAFVTGLVATGALQGDPSLAHLTGAAKSLDLGEAGLFALASLVVGLVLHPLQFALVQILEGYWGSTRLSILAMDAVAEVHIRRWDRLDADRRSALVSREALRRLRSERDIDAIGWERQYRRVRYLGQETGRLLARYPKKNRILPTTLGNRLRSVEDVAGRAWGINAVTAAPTISLVADPRDDSYLADTTAEVDVAVRLCIIWSLSTVAGILVLWRHGLWLLVPIVTYVLAYLSYRGAAVAADEQGAALSALIALNRFALYDRVGARRPTSTADERAQNRKLMDLLRDRPELSIEYSSEADALAKEPDAPVSPPYPVGSEDERD